MKSEIISKKEKLSLVYFLSNTFFLASGYSLIFKAGGKDSWLGMLIGILFGVIFIKITSKVTQKTNSKLNIIYYLFISFINILVLRIFVTSFLLTKTPGNLITIPFVVLSLYASKKGFKSILKISELLFPISVCLILLNMLAVSKDGSIDNFLPLLMASRINIFKSALYFFSFTTTPCLMINGSSEKITKEYLISSIFTLIIGIIIIYTLGPSLIKIFRFPEYMVLKQLQIFSFVEKIENLVSLVWLFNLFISISLCFYNISKITNENSKLNYLLIIIEIVLVEYVSNNYNYAMFIYKHLPYLLLIISLIYIITNFKHKKTTNS